jgi:hypothetical protein
MLYYKLKKMKKSAVLFVSIIYLFTTSCDQLVDTGLSNDEIIGGLKTALTAGTDTSADILNTPNGYFGDAAVKILLPPEADPILDYISDHPLIATILQSKIDDVVLSINRAAEDAASEAKPIFINAISTMSIEDGLNILQGKTVGVADFDSTAATIFLQNRTTAELTAAFAPIIDVSLNKKLVGDYSTNEIWSNLITFYNALGPAQPINGTLGEYATRKALDGMFLKVGVEEKKIRKDPFKWASDIIQKVFGYVFKES